VGEVDGYRPPPPFSPPSLRAEPLNGALPTAGPAPVARSGWTGHLTHRSPGRRALIVLLAAVGAAAVAVTLLTVDRTTSLRRLVLPHSVDQFQLQRALSPGEVIALARGGSLAGFGLGELTSARVGVYGDGVSAAPELVLVGLSARANADVRARLADTDPADLALDVVFSLGAFPGRPVDPGPLGGAVRCGATSVNGASASVGVWADRSTLGVLELLQTQSVDRTADLTRRFRAASEH
jgi:hypothetical protein